jgi:hypothetical protein
MFKKVPYENYAYKFQQYYEHDNTSSSEDEDVCGDGFGGPPEPPIALDVSLPTVGNPPDIINCDTACNGFQPGECFAVYPQCAGTVPGPNDDNLPDWTRSITAVETYRLLWVVTDIPTTLDTSDNNFDDWRKSTIPALPDLPRVSFVNNALAGNGQWSVPAQNFGTLTVSPGEQRIDITDDYVNRPNDTDVTILVTWGSPDETKLLRYFITRRYRFNATPQTFLLKTLPSDCLTFESKEAYPDGSGGVGDGADQSLEVFWDAVQLNDSTVTLDFRDIPVWAPNTYRDVTVRRPFWYGPSSIVGPGAAQTVDTSITLSNPTNNGLIVNGTTIPTTGADTTVTTSNFVNTDFSLGMSIRAEQDQITITSPFDGFISLKSFTTLVPAGVNRRVTPIEAIVVGIWELDANDIWQPIVEDVFGSSGGFSSSSFGNQPGFENANIALECEYWFNNWKLDNGTTFDYQTQYILPALNIQFSGDLCVYTDLAALQSNTRVLCKNPYDGDPAKIGLASIGGSKGIPTSRERGKYSFFLSRDLTSNNSLRIKDVVTLN